MAQKVKADPGALPEKLNPEQRLKRPQVSTLTGFGHTKLYAEIKAKRFPPPERDGPRCSRWRAGDVLDYLQRRREAAAGSAA